MKKNITICIGCLIVLCGYNAIAQRKSKLDSLNRNATKLFIPSLPPGVIPPSMAKKFIGQKKRVYGTILKFKFPDSKFSKDSASILFYMTDYGKKDIYFILCMRIDKRDPKQFVWINFFKDPGRQASYMQKGGPEIIGAEGMIVKYKHKPAMMINPSEFEIPGVLD